MGLGVGGVGGMSVLGGEGKSWEEEGQVTLTLEMVILDKLH